MRWVMMLIALSLAIPAAAAGTREQPEIQDESGDTYVYPAAPGAGPVADMMDITAVWIEENDETVLFNIQVVDLEPAQVSETNPAGDARWWVEFLVVQPDGTVLAGERPWEVRAFVSQGTVYATRFSLEDPRKTDSQEIVGVLDVASDTIVLEVPKEMLEFAPGARLTDLYSRTGTYFPAYPSWIGDDGAGDRTAYFQATSEPTGEVPAPAGNDSLDAPLPFALPLLGIGAALRIRRP